MSSDLYFDGKKYISSRRAADLCAYTQDYVGQLIRSKKLEAKMVGRSWFVEEDSILTHKRLAEEAAQPIFTKEPESLAVIEEVISASREAPVVETVIEVVEPVIEVMPQPVSSFVYSSDDRSLLPELKKVRRIEFPSEIISRPVEVRQTVRPVVRLVPQRPLVGVSESIQSPFDFGDLANKVVAIALSLSIVIGGYHVSDPERARAALSSVEAVGARMSLAITDTYYKLANAVGVVQGAYIASVRNAGEYSVIGLSAFVSTSRDLAHIYDGAVVGSGTTLAAASDVLESIDIPEIARSIQVGGFDASASLAAVSNATGPIRFGLESAAIGVYETIGSLFSKTGSFLAGLFSSEETVIVVETSGATTTQVIREVIVSAPAQPTSSASQPQVVVATQPSVTEVNNYYGTSGASSAETAAQIAAATADLRNQIIVAQNTADRAIGNSRSIGDRSFPSQSDFNGITIQRSQIKTSTISDSTIANSTINDSILNSAVLRGTTTAESLSLSDFNGFLYAVNGVIGTTSTSSLGIGLDSFEQGGNSFGTTAVLGTNDVQSLALETSGVTRFTINGSGNISVGTTTASDLLSLAGVTGGNNLRITNSTTGRYTQIGHDGSGFFIQPNTTNDDITFKSTTATPFMIIRSSSGNVGIGTSSPSSKLSVAGGAYFGGTVTATGTISAPSFSATNPNGTTTLAVLDNTSYANIIKVFEGDSLSDGPTDWASVIMSKSPEFGKSTKYNFSLTGDKALLMVGQYATQAGAVKPTRNIDDATFFLLAGTNDITLGTSAADIYTALKTLWANARADRYKVVAFTVPPSGTFTPGNGKEAVRQDLNNLILSDPALYDHMIRMDLLFPDTNDLNNFDVDTLHLTTAAQSALAQYVADALTYRPYAFTPSTGTTTKTASNLILNPIGANVGIGTTSPYAKLSVAGETASTYFTTASTTATSTFAGGFSAASSFYVLQNGRVAIGTSTPISTAMLHIVSPTSNNALKISVPGAATSIGAELNNDAQRWAWQLRGDMSNSFVLRNETGSTFPLAVTTAGNVGIGTTSPSNRLEVAGSGYFAGNLTAANITATGTLSVLGSSTFAGLSFANGTSSGSFAVGTTTGSGYIGWGGYGYNASLSVDGGAKIVSNTGETLIQNNTNYLTHDDTTLFRNNVLAIQNTGLTATNRKLPSAIRFLNETGAEMGAIGYSNDDVWAPFAQSFFISASQPYYPGVGSSAPTRMALLQEGLYGGSARYAPRLEFNADWTTNFKDPLGNVNFTIAPTGTSTFRYALTAQTATSSVLTVTNAGGTYNTTSGSLTSYAGNFSSVSTRASGSNSLTNVGLYVTASGAQNNYAAIFDQGNVGIGTSTPFDKLTVSGNVLMTNGSVLYGYDVGGNRTAMARIAGGTNDLYLGGSFVGNVFLGTGAGTQRLTIQNGGNVGIGTTTPAYTLTTVGSESVAANSSFTGSVTGVSTNSESHGIYNRLRGNSAGISGLTFANQLISNGGNALEIYTTGSQPVVFGTNSTEYARLTQTGNFGIGSSSPASRFVVQGSTANRYFTCSGTAFGCTLRVDDNSSGIALSLENRDATAVADHGVTVPVFFGRDTDSTARGAGNLSWRKEQVWTSTASTNDSYFVLATTLDGTQSEKFRITSGGNVGIGNVSPAYLLDVGAPATGGSVARFKSAVTNSAADVLIVDVDNSNSRAALQVQGNNGAVESLFVSSGGNVGIGTTTPNAILDIAAGSGSDTPGSNLLLGLGTSNSVQKFGLRYNTAASTLNLDRLSGGVWNSMVTFDRLTGNVGIGTTTPTRLLSVNGSAQFGDNTSTATANPLNVSFGGTYGNNTPGTVGNLKWDMFTNISGNRYGIGMSQNLMEYQAGNAGQHAFFVNQGTEAMRILANGSVGIGTTTPSNLLHVYGSGATGLAVERNTSGNSNILFKNTVASIYAGLNSGSGFAIGTNPDLGSNPYLTITNTGNVGIGTTSPSGYTSTRKTLAIQDTVNDTTIRLSGTAADVEWFTNSNGSGFFNRSASSVMLGTNNIERMRITADGNVGIGTTTPDSLLSVSGAAASLRLDRTGGGEPNITFSQSGSAVSNVRGVTGGGLRFTNGAATVEWARFDSSGNLGIGTSSPQKMFHVYGTATNARVRLQSSTGGLTTYSEIGTSDSGDFNILADHSSGAANSAINFFVDGSQRAIINSSGNFGIGTTSPVASLSVASSGFIGQILKRTGAAGNGVMSKMENSNGNYWGQAIFGADNSFGLLYNSETLGTNQFLSVSTAGNVGIGTTSPIAKLTVVGETLSSFFTATSTTATTSIAGSFDVANGAIRHNYATGQTSIDNIQLGNMNFESDSGVVTWVDMPVTAASAAGVKQSYTAGINGNPLLTVYAESDGIGGIQNSGVGIGTSTPLAKLDIWGNFRVSTSTSSATPLVFANTASGMFGIGTSSPTAQLHTTGTVRFSNFGSGTLATDASGNVSVSSDERLKDIAGNFNRGLEDIKKISPILYKWNATSGLDMVEVYAGFSAQNVDTAIPEAVGKSPNGYLSLNDRPILATAVNAIKELAINVASSTERMMSAEARIAGLELAVAGLSAGSNVTVGTTSTSTASSTIETVSGWFTSLGTTIENAIARFVAVIADSVITKKLKVGDASNLAASGITIFDRFTGEPVCMYIENGVMKNEPGECGAGQIVPPLTQPEPAPEPENTGENASSTPLVIESEEEGAEGDTSGGDTGSSTPDAIIEPEPETTPEPEVIPQTEEVPSEPESGQEEPSEPESEPVVEETVE